MSKMNTRKMKRARSLERTERKGAAARRIPFGGVIVDRRMVRQHRYLAVKGLPYSASVANVEIGTVRQRMAA